MVNLINVVEKKKVDRFIIHARIAILEGLSPRENRDIPPLRYEEVYRLKEEFPYLNIEINGGVKNAKSIKKCEAKGEPGHLILRHTQGLFFDERGSKLWKQLISPPWEKGVNVREVMTNALNTMPHDVLDKRIME